MKQTVHNFKLTLMLVAAGLISLISNAQTSGIVAPELVFKNPVLVKGTLNKEGATYRFSNVTSGVDAELKLKKFSRNDIVMQDVDLGSMGWDKALQPQFGLPGVVAPNQTWYIDFEMTFYDAGSNKKRKMQKAVFTALDVDGDGWSISEFAEFNNVSTTAYAPVSNLVGGGTITFLANGQSTLAKLCPEDNILSIVENCSKCNGTGTKDGNDCDDCDGSGKVFKQCKHAFPLTQTITGPVANYNNIDTGATQVMVTYTYLNKDKVTFRYGAKSGALSSNGSGIRLNSVWGKSFSLIPWMPTLPLTFTGFSLLNQKGDAVLSWKTTADEKLNLFRVQRSTDGVNFSDIATVFASASATYSYTDKSVSSATGLVYYRIVSVDYTKETLASDVKMIRLTKAETTALAITAFPNPVVNELRISLPASWQGKEVAFEVYRTDGILVKKAQVSSAGQIETVAVNSLAKGTYVVKAAYGTESAAQRIVKN